MHPNRSLTAPHSLLLASILATLLALEVSGGESRTAELNPPRYSVHLNPSPDGTGKFYLGREIAQVMGHQGAAWLERTERKSEERPDETVRALRLKAGDRVADIGAGTGYFTRRLARGVGEEGEVHAVDVQPRMLELLRRNLEAGGIRNVKRVLGTSVDPNLPEGYFDLILMVDVYHEFSHPHEMLRAVCRALKPGGRVAFVEYRAEDPTVPIKPLHKMSEAQVRKEAAAHPLVWVETVRTLPWQHLILFRKEEIASTSPARGARRSDAETPR